MAQRFQRLRKNAEICRSSFEGARLQPRRTSFLKTYGTAEAVPFQSFQRQEFFRKLFQRGDNRLPMNKGFDMRGSKYEFFPSLLKNLSAAALLAEMPASSASPLRYT
ncbi:MAG: hypothetical protein WB711_22065 [Terriglobales bacterium]